MSSAPTEIPVPDHSGAWLAIAAGNYYDADLALWTLKAALGDRAATPAEQAHLDHLRARRKAAYADLVQWTMLTEAERQASVS
jgi:hypothetical protein